jgi:hypothetical protein
MKGMWKKLKRDEKGQALIIVIILLVLGGLIIAPLLGFMSSGLVAGQVYEVNMEGLYAADSGIEDACWKLMRGQTPEGDQPFCNLTDMNGMDVEVIQEPGVPPVDVGDGILYTLQSTARLPGETEPETTIIAQIMVEVGSVGEGGEGGQYKTNEEMAALSVLDEYNFIFTIQNPAYFWGREDPFPDLEFATFVEQCDLANLDFAAGHASTWLDGDEVMTQPKYKINGVHFYHDEVDDYDYLLMTIKTTADVGYPPVSYNNNDIFKLHIDPDDPARWTTELMYTINADLIGLSARGIGDAFPENDVILFVMSNNTAILGGQEFHSGDIIEYYPDTGAYSRLVDVESILGDIPNQPTLIFDCISVLPAPDPRILISFTSDAGVTGSNGVEIQAEDIAIWDPGEDETPNTPDDTINLHISMTEETEMNVVGNVIIVSWDISY